MRLNGMLGDLERPCPLLFVNQKRLACTPRRGIEPRPPAWQAGILTTILSRTVAHLYRLRFHVILHKLMLTQKSYRPSKCWEMKTVWRARVSEWCTRFTYAAVVLICSAVDVHVASAIFPYYPKNLVAVLMANSAQRGARTHDPEISTSW